MHHFLSPFLAFLILVSLIHSFWSAAGPAVWSDSTTHSSWPFWLRQAIDFLPCMMTGASCGWCSVPVWMGRWGWCHVAAEGQGSPAAAELQAAASPLPRWSRCRGFLRRGSHPRRTFCLMIQLKEEQIRPVRFSSWYNVVPAMVETSCSLKGFLGNKGDAASLLLLQAMGTFRQDLPEGHQGAWVPLAWCREQNTLIYEESWAAPATGLVSGEKIKRWNLELSQEAISSLALLSFNNLGTSAGH